MRFLELIAAYNREGLSERAIVTKLQNQGIKTSKTSVHRSLVALRASSSCQAKKPRRFNRKLNQRAVRTLVRLIRFHEIRQTVGLQREMERLGMKVSCRTIRRALRKVPTIQLKRPRQQQFMTAQHKRLRLQWARETLEEGVDWSDVFFADEKVWFVDGPAWRPHMWIDKRDPLPVVHRKGTRNCAIHVWGAFSLDVVPDLALVPVGMKSEQYCGIVENQLLSLPSVQQPTLFHDRHPCHKSAVTQAWMASHDVTARLFPAKDADINPIENLWGILTGRVFKGTQTYSSQEELYAAIQKEWRKIQQDRELREKLVVSMQDRLRQLVSRRGGPLPY